MAERDPRRHSPPPPSSSNSGLLSNVFSFVSREIESFVTNATGGTVQDEDPRDYARRSKGPANGVHRTKKRHRGRTDEVKRHGRDREGRRRVASPASPSQSSPRGILPQSRSDAHGRRNGTPQARVAAPEQEASAVEDEETEYTVSVHSRSPSPKQQKPALRRRSSISMPGSLFPRSTSLEPDSPDEDEQHVRFDSHQPSRVSGAGPSDPRASRREASPEHVPSSPLRPRAVPSVKEAVSRFVVTDDGADASILLPSPSVSPGNRREKRQCRDGDGLSEKAKGKQRAVEEEYVPLTHRDRATAIPISEADTSADIRVRGKERELVVAREEQHANERRWEQDKNDDAAKENSKNKERIKMLEEEIMRLKAELLRRPAVSSASDTRNMHLPPPPPPPPPPPLPLPGVKSRLPAATRATSDSLFASARAALKHTGTPVEAPINGPALGSRAKRQGQPTVNVPSDKMAAFLNEMKTVRLRKVSGGAQGAPASSATSSMAGTSALARSTSSASGSGPSRFAVPARPSLPFDTRAGQERLGEKRKRDEFQDTLHTALKRRSIASTATNSYASTSTAVGRSLPSSRFQGLPVTSAGPSHPLPSRVHPGNRTWPSVSTEADLATPSLCSDNEPDSGTSPDEVPSTPPVVPPPEAVASKASHREVIDVDMDHEPRYTQYGRAGAISPQQYRRLDSMFSKRPPTSPMPVDTPRKPRPPTRSRGRVPSTPHPRASEDDDDDDPLSLSFSENDGEIIVPKAKPRVRGTPHPASKKKAAVSKQAMGSPISRSASRQRSGTGSRQGSMVSGASRHNTREASVASAGKHKRRLTLDEELRDADLDSGVLTGVGTRSKHKGFLAHGGAGGAPVFMGVGYVEGAEEDDEYDDVGDEDDYHPPRHATVKAKGKR